MGGYIFQFQYEDKGGLRTLGSLQDDQVLGPDGKLKIPQIYETVLLNIEGKKKGFMVKSKHTSYRAGGDVIVNFVVADIQKTVTDIQKTAVANIAKTWGDLEKQMPELPPISVVGTTPEVSQQIKPQPPAGSTIVTKRKWLNKVMDKTAAEGYELDGYTVSVGIPPRVDLHYKRKD